MLDIRRCHRHTARKNWQIQDRCIEDHIIYAVHAGTIRIILDGHEHQWESGSIGWVSPGVQQSAHGVRPTGSAVRFTVLRVYLAHGGEPLMAPQQHLCVPQQAALLQCFEQLEDLMHTTPHRVALRQRTVLTTLFAGMMDAAQQDSQSGLSARRRHKLYSWFADHLSHQPSASDLAQVCELSPSHFRRVFRAEFGCTPRQWISRERLRSAAEQLHASSASVQSIAEACGYASTASFCRLFTKAYGESPHAWRQG